MDTQTTQHNAVSSIHSASHTAGLGPHDGGEKSTSTQPASDGDVMDGLSLRMPPQVSSLDTSNSPPSKNSINVLCDLPACRVTFNPSSIQQHLVQHHTNLERKDGKITCPIDGHRVTEANYGRHILNVHFKHLKGWCDICKKDLSRKDNLKRHMKTHMGQD